ncbi:UDP-N-acetylhexosamine pyrophosphorylase-like protein 1 [Liparis tanakae]|uniref:UDP-N-acetylhexosamine pyrophosphorylase-like protein 1 n=1 Tax=Liparis tanakae TaxID=230148 RepID=A0A4Z2EX89_9TELE|nr:UDP-N-acetylhexosamine pyrophosphorylase-like protein 1 [Liparis tanakae]
MLPLERVTRGLARAGQTHVLQFWPELCEAERAAFLQELSQLDLQGLRDHCEGAARAAAATAARLDQHMEPVPPESIGSARKSDEDSLAMWGDEGSLLVVYRNLCHLQVLFLSTGLLQISASRVGVLLLAGGQGTRLGVRFPKGLFDVGLPSRSSLYRIQAERIHKVQQLADRKHGSRCSVPWYIMTSEFTLAPTETFFKENDYFGLEPSNVVLFEQRMLPAVTFDGKVILQGKGKLAMAPDGNGGLYQALEDHKVLEDMQERGVQYLHVYCVDNILVKMADPLFIGFCVTKGADCGAKVVEKAYAAEPVGVVCRVRGVAQVVEYSEIQPETAELRGPGGGLLYSAGNICNHFFTRAFLQDAAA